MMVKLSLFIPIPYSSFRRWRSPIRQTLFVGATLLVSWAGAAIAQTPSTPIRALESSSSVSPTSSSSPFNESLLDPAPLDPAPLDSAPPPVRAVEAAPPVSPAPPASSFNESLLDSTFNPFNEPSFNEPWVEESFVEELPLRITIDLSDRRLTLYRGTTVLHTYPVAVGREGWQTPTGEFEVRQMVQDPTWMNPFTREVVEGGHPRNPLGRYWIGFWTDGTNWVGMHGTPNPETVGTAASHGCIRLYNDDIQALFGQVTMGTPVTVVP